MLTAGHCVSGGAGTANPIKTTAYFCGGPDPDVVNHTSPDAIGIDAAAYFVNPNYTGEVIDQTTSRSCACRRQRRTMPSPRRFIVAAT